MATLSRARVARPAQPGPARIEIPTPRTELDPAEHRGSHRRKPARRGVLARLLRRVGTRRVALIGATGSLLLVAVMLCGALLCAGGSCRPGPWPVGAVLDGGTTQPAPVSSAPAR